MKLLKIGAVAGALALAGSLGLGVSAAHAVVDPIVTVTNANAEGVVPNGYVEASITGCSVADGAVNYDAYLYNYDNGEAYPLSAGPMAAPATGAITVTANTPLPGEWSIDVECYSYDGQPQGEYNWADFTSDRGLVSINNGEQFNLAEPVSLTSAELAGGVTAFDPTSQITLWVIGPDGTRFDLGTVAATAAGSLDTMKTLPFTIDGVYTVYAEGVKTNQEGTAEPVTVQVLLYNQYERVTPPAPEAPPAAPPASGPKPGDKPTALPRTGSEGMGLVPAAALISVVAGGLAVALRSRKH